MYKIVIKEKARQDMAYLKKTKGKAIIEKINRLLQELMVHPKTGTGKPEQLKYNYAGFWSRRIDSTHRLIYTIEEEIVTVTVISALGHYDNR